MKPAQDRPRRNVVVIGGSAGSLSAVSRVLAKLPADFPASVFFVQHISASHSSVLANILDGRTKMSVEPARDGAPIVAGEVRVAVPDLHLLIGPAHVSLTRGPRECHARPAIDPLFRSAALHHQDRVVAVLLSGYLSDGAAGLCAVHACGGLTIVQDPSDAEVPDMPVSALERLAPDYVAPAGRIGELVAELAVQPAPKARRAIPLDILTETEMAFGERLAVRDDALIGGPLLHAGPDSRGPSWPVSSELPGRRSPAQHPSAPPDLANGEEMKLYEALWAALRGMRERAELLRSMADDAERAGRRNSVERLTQSLTEIEAQADTLQRFIAARATPFA